MSKRIKPFNEFETMLRDGKCEKSFLRMSPSQLDAMSYHLENSAFRVYIMMKMSACGKIEFEFPHRKYQMFMANKTFIDARNELIREGYIEPFISNKNLRKANKYKFSSKWVDITNSSKPKLMKEK